MPVSTDQLVAEVIIKDFASAVADRVAASATRMGDAVEGATEKRATSTRTLETQAKQFERLKASIDPVYAAQQRLAEIGGSPPAAAMNATDHRLKSGPPLRRSRRRRPINSATSPHRRRSHTSRQNSSALAAFGNSNILAPV